MSKEKGAQLFLLKAQDSGPGCQAVAHQPASLEELLQSFPQREVPKRGLALLAR